VPIPQTRWGSLQRSPRPTSWNKGVLLLREGEGRKKGGRDGKRRKEGIGREGKGKKTKKKEGRGEGRRGERKKGGGGLAIPGPTNPSLLSGAAVSVCMYVCMYVSQTITFESINTVSSYLHIRYITREYGSSSYMKVIESRSRSQEQQRSIIPVPSM